MATTKTGTEFSTRIDLSGRSRSELVELLNARLADISDLYTQLKQAHWTVRGADFAQLHELYDEAAEAVFPFIDELAERVGTLGGLARGTARMAASASTLEEYPEEAIEDADTLEVVADRLAACAVGMRSAIERSEELGDMATSDLFIEVTRTLDKQLWFVEAHLQR
ncbi:MAG TPA: DNA starvation/stationary phase protection protein Dps [Gaiella sp.]|jgi:starvation-inducible DNA-binding protein